MANQNPCLELREALRLLGAYTGGRYDVWMLMGPAKASCRVHIMSAARGVKVPQSKSGVNAVASELYERCEITGTCEADRHRNLAIYAKGVINGAAPVAVAAAAVCPVCGGKTATVGKACGVVCDAELQEQNARARRSLELTKAARPRHAFREEEIGGVVDCMGNVSSDADSGL